MSKVGRPPRLYARRHKIYKLVEDTKTSPKERMELILTQNVPKVGDRGDTVFVKKSVGRNKLLPEGLAVYPSPENKALFAEELRLFREGKLEDRVQTRTGKMTVEFLKCSKLKIHQMPCEEFQVNKEIVCRQLVKKLGVVVPPHALKLPFESVKEVGEYWCEVTVNGMDTVRIPISLVPYEDLSASHQKTVKTQRQQQAAVPEAAAEEEEEVVLKAEAAAESEAAKDSAAEETVETTQTAQESPATPSEEPKTK